MGLFESHGLWLSSGVLFVALCQDLMPLCKVLTSEGCHLPYSRPERMLYTVKSLYTIEMKQIAYYSADFRLSNGTKIMGNGGVLLPSQVCG